MTPALPDGTTWMNVPPPKNPPADLGGNGDPGTYEADAGYNGPSRACCDLHNGNCYDVEEICCADCPGVPDSISNPPRGGCWRTTEAGRAAVAAVTAALDNLTDEQWDRLGGRPDGERQAAAITRIRERAAARHPRRIERT